jgi:pyruvate/2-oxoglutarate dehydrogenase complex dihydrolipoamide dehydrogenase (E3) component
MERIEADICVIGAGSAGLSVAAGAAQLGAATVLFEKGEMGGDCLNTGCIPSKSLIALRGYEVDTYDPKNPFSLPDCKTYIKASQ